MDQPIEVRLATWWRELLSVSAVGVDDDFFDSGGDSIIAARLFDLINKTYHVNLVLSTLFEANTIRQLAKVIQTAQECSGVEPQVPAVVRLQEAHSASPLFIISGLGGNVLNFKQLATYFADSYPLYALQPKGLDGREACHTRVEDTAAYYVTEMKRVQPNGPYFLGGYSFGGLIAFEAAQQLAANGEQVGFLGLLDTIECQYQLQVKSSLSSQDRRTLFKSRVRALFLGRDGWEYLIDRLKTKSYIVARRALAAIGMDSAWGSISNINSYAALLYRPKVYPGAVTIFRTTERELLDGNDEFLGWRGLVAGPITVRSVPGNHFTMTREPNVRILAEQLRESLEQARIALADDSSPRQNAVTLQANGS